MVSQREELGQKIILKRLPDNTYLVELTPYTNIDSIFNAVLAASPGEYHEDLVLENNSGEELAKLAEHKGKNIKDAGINLTNSRYIIRTVNTNPSKMLLSVQPANFEDDMLLGASASPTMGDSEPLQQLQPLPMLMEDSYKHYSSYTAPRSTLSIYNSPEATSQDEVEYVGLVNQAMTCYLNSLLQALFMTPEFRNALYNWEFDGQNETRSIPFQLQKLFLKLQTASKSAVETTDLTTSFGWHGSEAWQQHDIQELCRVMFDALEQKFKSTKQANLINDLYEGKMLDYVKCLECGTEKSREDTFLDIPLPVRPFGSQVAYNSVEEALRAFVQPETLDGNNQYHCEKCEKKCNAHKGLKFTKFPYLLTLHLKRFDFDYTTLHRIKLNDKVVFPDKLNLNSFIPNNLVERDVEERDGIKYDDCCTTDSGAAEDENCQSADASSNINCSDTNCGDSDEGIDVSSGNHHVTEASGPYLYDLFSIMIHSGSATGGHYYAYIKDFDKNQWFCFNDQSVSRITEEDIKKTYGGNTNRGYYSGAYSSSINAYMLMYRQVDPLRNSQAMKQDEFPPHIKKLLVDMKNKEEKDRIFKQRENDSIRLCVLCFHPLEKRLLEAPLTVLSDSTLEEIADSAYQHPKFHIDSIVQRKDCRLVKYRYAEECIYCSYDSDQYKLEDVMKMSSKFESSVTHNYWLLEIRSPNSEWQVYEPGAINLKVFPVNLQTEDLEEPIVIRVNVNETVGELKKRLGVLLTLEPNSLEIVMVNYLRRPKSEVVYFSRDDQVVHQNGRSQEKQLFVSISDDNMDKAKFVIRLKKFVEWVKQVVIINVSLPDISSTILDSLAIPSLDLNQNVDNSDMAGGDGTNSPCNISRTAASSNGLNKANLVLLPRSGMNSNSALYDGFGDQSNSEDSSLSDSDRTLVGDNPGEHLDMSTNGSNSPIPGWEADPLDAINVKEKSEEMQWEDPDSTVEDPMRDNYYFKVVNISSTLDTDLCQRNCKVLMDVRMPLERLKANLEPYVRVPVGYFKVYKQSANTEHEWTNQIDTPRMLKHDDKLVIKLGRNLKKDEFNCKVFLLKLEQPDDPFFYLFDHVITKGQTYGQITKEIVMRAKKLHGLELTHNNFRLREKLRSSKEVRGVLLENKVCSEVLSDLGWDLCLQELPEKDRYTSTSQTIFWVRHWRPSKLELGPLQEIIIDSSNSVDVMTELSKISGIPSEYIEITMNKNASLPGDMHILKIHKELTWHSVVLNIKTLAEDGDICFFRDSREELKELTPLERKEINESEKSRLGRSVKTFSPGKERALKIYVDVSPAKPEERCTD